MRSFLILSFCAVFIMLGTAMSFANEMVIKVDGMTCAVCVAAVTEALKANENVEEVDIDLETGFVTVRLKEGQELEQETIAQLITDAGYKPFIE